jgi:hypothetical protein
MADIAEAAFSSESNCCHRRDMPPRLHDGDSDVSCNPQDAWGPVSRALAKPSICMEPRDYEDAVLGKPFVCLFVCLALLST